MKKGQSNDHHAQNSSKYHLSQKLQDSQVCPLPICQTQPKWSIKIRKKQGSQFYEKVKKAGSVGEGAKQRRKH